MFFLVILVVSTVFHLLTTGRVLRTYGIRWAILVAPVLLLLGSAAVFLIPVGAMLAWACFVRGSDKTFDNTLSQSVRELLYIPVSADVKYRAKLFIDMFVSKFATGLGAALFLLLYATRQFAYRTDQPLAVVREIGLVVLVFLALWLVLTRLVYREYPAVLKKDLGRLWVPGQDVVDEHIDEKLVREVFEAIQSRERSTTLYYMNVFNLVRSNNLTPELKELLGIKRDEIKARAMDALFDVGGEAFFPGLDEAITDTEFQKEIDLIFLLPSYQKIMDERLGGIVASPSEVDRIEAANSICRMAPSPATLDALSRLLQDPSPDVVLYALNSASVHRRREHLPLILRQLANPHDGRRGPDGPGRLRTRRPGRSSPRSSARPTSPWRSAGPSRTSWPGSAPRRPPTSSSPSWPAAATTWSSRSSTPSTRSGPTGPRSASGRRTSGRSSST